MSPFEILVEDARQQLCRRQAPHFTTNRTFLIGTAILRAQMRLRETGACVVHMNGSGGIENVFDTTSSVYGDSP